MIKSKAKTFVENVDLISIDEFVLDGANSEEVDTGTSSSGSSSLVPLSSNSYAAADLKTTLNAYLKSLVESEVRSLEDLISYNIKHADKELPP